MRYLLILLAGLVAFSAQGRATGTDYFIALGGGYEPSGNQASLEANILFFRTVLSESHRGNRSETTFFADGNDSQPDLQVAVPTPDGPLPTLIAQLNQRGGGPAVEYRNHQIANLAGPLSPERIRSSLRDVASRLKTGDRMLVYVTAHGEAGKDDEVFNTYISCWNNERFSAREFSQWIDSVPADIPVIMVMAQCYCGGFSHAIFRNLDATSGVDNHLRCGFFAQQHDLPAAGCRPDIENDDEYSSFFWGAFVGRSRNGRPLVEIDSNRDGRVSFAEAHAQAVIACESIDIPLRTSEALLRFHSRIEGYEHRGAPEVSRDEVAGTSDDETSDNDNDSDQVVVRSDSEPKLHPMQGSIRELADAARPDVKAAIEALSSQLELSLNADITELFAASSAHDDAFRQLRRQGGRGRRGRSSGRRELREAIADQWPELADRQGWRSSPLLAADKQAEIMDQIAELPSYKQVADSMEAREKLDKELDQAEIRSIKFQRLIGLLETVVLTRNLPATAPDMVDPLKRIVDLEESSW